ncbi:MAG TPA: isoprenylcysteine carboxylmethyltransferase family protein [Longimicrobiales bacterium]
MDSPGVRFPPPLLFVGALGLAALLRTQWPLLIVVDESDRAIMLIVAYGLIAAGMLWMAWGLVTFRRARTGIIPNRPASRIVREGPYRFGRNPMYLGMTAVYWGVTLWLDTWWALIFFPVVIMLLLTLVIAREERYLREAFPGDYDEYTRAVSRWLGKPPSH